MTNPSKKSKNARITDPPLTIQAVLVWIVRQRGPVTLPDVATRFSITGSNAGVRLLRLMGAKLIRREKSRTPPRIYSYTPTASGKKRTDQWTNKRGA